MDYLPTTEEHLLSLVGLVSAGELIEALGIETFRLDGVDGVVVKPLTPKTELFDMSTARPATADETKLHVQDIHDGLLMEAQCGLI